MAFTKRTPNADLPQWEADDKPSWMGDMNLAMARIDAYIGGLKGQINDLQNQINNMNNGV